MGGDGATADEGTLGVASARAGVLEVCWLGTAGVPRATAAVPLAYGGRPAVALLWSQADVARELAAAPAVGWVLSDRRLAQPGWYPLLGMGRMHMIEDRNGTLFTDNMLDMELRKHPPSRAYADTLLLRRENWWFLPRLVLVFEPWQVSSVGERTSPDEHAVLAVSPRDGSLHVDTVSIDQSGTAMTCRSLARRAPPPGDAVLFTHDFSVPDLERWARHATTGRWDGTSLDVVSRDDQRGVPPPPGLRERIRRHREMERGCRAALKSL